MMEKFKELYKKIRKKEKPPEEIPEIPTQPFALTTHLQTKLDKFINHIREDAKLIKDDQQRKRFEEKHQPLINLAIDLQGDLGRNYDLWMQQLMQTKPTKDVYIRSVGQTLERYATRFNVRGAEAVMTDLQNTVSSALEKTLTELKEKGPSLADILEEIERSEKEEEKKTPTKR